MKSFSAIEKIAVRYIDPNVEVELLRKMQAIHQYTTHKMRLQLSWHFHTPTPLSAAVSSNFSRSGLAVDWLISLSSIGT